MRRVGVWVSVSACRGESRVAAVKVRVAVIGGGSWGTTVAHLCAHNAPTVLYARDPSVADAVSSTGENARYLPGRRLHPDLRATADIAAAAGGADAVVMGVPSHGFRDTLRLLRPHVGERTPIVSLTKGLEAGTRKRMTEVVADELPGRAVGVLTGPNLAKEILAGQAAAAVLAMAPADMALADVVRTEMALADVAPDDVAPADMALAERLQGVLCAGDFRVYTNTDVVGAEIAGATKNVIALAAGIADGLEAGDNTRAALITRGLAEVTRLGVALGGDPRTFAGLAGIGDIVATCVSTQSRNRHVGERLGRGEAIGEIVASMDQVAEGVKSTPVVAALARSRGVDMPITEAVRSVIEDGRPAAAAYRALLDRPPTSETRR